MKTIIFVIISLFSAFANAIPDAFQAHYVIKKSGITLGTMNSQLTYQGARYRYYRRTEAKGIVALFSGDTITEESKGLINNGKLTPKSFAYQHQSKKKHETERFRFVTPTKVIGKLNGKSYQLSAVPKHSIDSLLLNLQLRQDLMIGKSTFNYSIIDKGELKNYRLQPLGIVTVQVPAGTFETTKIKVLRDNGKRETILWLAKKLNYLPVQIKHTDKGTTFESKLESYRKL